MRYFLASLDRQISRRVSPGIVAGSQTTRRAPSVGQTFVSALSRRCACGGSCPRCEPHHQALPAPLRGSMESRLGASFADVRVHTDDNAARLAAHAHAHAFTIGSDIFFGAGRFAPHTTEGATRLAHELVHVQQQRIGLREGWHPRAPEAEREARELGAAAAAGAHVSVRAAAPPSVQRDGPESEGSAPPASAQSATPQLQLDPEIERLMLQHYIRWWLGATLVYSNAPATVPTSPDPNVTAEPAKQAGVPSIPGIPGLPPAPIWSQLPLDPPFFAPLPPDRLFLEPDVGALFSGFGQRGAPIGAGDSRAVLDIYLRNEAIVRGLPDLRSMAPRFLQPLIPLTWRRDIAGALTSAAVGASLKRDYPTAIEVSDRAWQGMTVASTTVIPLPSISFDLF